MKFIVFIFIVVITVITPNSTASTGGTLRRSGSNKVKVKTPIGPSNSSSTPTLNREEPAEVDLVCHPKRPLIEPLIAAGLVGNSSRLPLKLQKRPNSEYPQRKNIFLVCQITRGVSGGDEYLCKPKRSDDADSSGSGTTDDEVDEGVISGDYYEVLEEYS